ncbi:MAG: ATP synthase F1 subunit epsilon [Lachnospiraceae bacterium]|nr:ATP synthase F1 subunit epsilon [Lachnospiraceae bacterium]MBR6999136.1 ATP synthase F1 subunit epsilon [Lachnospiraceae bacterium]MCR5531236.1 ATP synthase F1 subunit epsilon [Lachnospiraceae bacterium]
MVDEKHLQLKVYSPTRIFFEGEAEFVEFVTTEGELGVYPNHIPLTAVVAPGILRITENGKVREATLLDGFATILPKEIIILSEACEWPEEIDIHRAEEARIRAERKLAMEQTVRDELALRRAIVRMQLANKYR